MSVKIPFRFRLHLPIVVVIVTAGLILGNDGPKRTSHRSGDASPMPAGCPYAVSAADSGSGLNGITVRYSPGLRVHAADLRPESRAVANRFIDRNGDGFNDNAPDHDDDGIPNGFDPDWRAPDAPRACPDWLAAGGACTCLPDSAASQPAQP